MADGVKVGRYLDEVNKKVKSLQKNVDDLNKENRELDKTLKFDPKNTDALVTKTQNLEKAVQLATQKLNLLKEKQKEVKKEFDDGIVSQSELNKFNISIAKASAEVAQLNDKLKKTQSFDFKNLASSLQPVSNIAKAILVSLTGIITSYALTGDEISKTMDKYKIGAEEIQKQSLYFDRASGDANNYTGALTQINMQLGALEKGSAKAVKAFALLGLSEEQLQGLNAAEALDLVIQQLRLIEDESERAATATALLGNAGLNVALVAGLTEEQIAEFNEELERTGIITDEQAIAAGELNDKLDTVKFTFASTAAEVGLSMIPVLEAFINVINSLLPVLTKLTDGFNKLSPAGKTVVAVVLILLAILPKLISIGTAVVKLVQVMNTASLVMVGKILLIVGAVALLVEGVLQLINAINKLRGVSSDLSLKNLFSSKIGELEGLSASTNDSSSTVINNNYTYDYSTMTNEFTDVVDTDEVIEAINTKIKVRR